MRSPIVKLIIAITLTVGIGSLGGLFNAGETDTWFTTVRKPSFNPPNWLFAPVWTTLYFLMGISVYLVWKKPASRERNIALTLFVMQFVFNFFWSFIFFKLHEIGWALVEIIVLWLLIVLTMIRFGRISSTAAWLLAPYLAWVSFATVLTASIYSLNS